MTTEEKIYSIAPSDLSYGMDCPACFRAKVIDGWRKPSGGIAGFLNRNDKLMRDIYQGMNSSRFGLPQGKIDTPRGYIKSNPITLPSGLKVIINCQLDAIAAFFDNTHGLIDFKTSKLNEDKITRYRRQLHACAHAVKDPAPSKHNYEPREVVSAHLVAIFPESMEFEGEYDETPKIRMDDALHGVSPKPSVFTADLMRLKTEIVDLGYSLGYWAQLLVDIDKAMTGQLEPKHNCPECALRNSGWKPEKKSKKKAAK